MIYIRPNYITATPPKNIKTVKAFEAWAKRELHKVKNSLTYRIRSNH